ncbi:MAG TPA: hypothetical protein VME40_14560 [Caulobacteraceae bacterium]|nr:hypothetical protein [Caulobacteraceae bacterium]
MDWTPEIEQLRRLRERNLDVGRGGQMDHDGRLAGELRAPFIRLLDGAGASVRN